MEKYCTAGQATDDIITRRMRIAYRKPKTINILSEYVILTAFPPHRNSVSHERTRMFPYTRSTLCVLLKMLLYRLFSFLQERESYDVFVVRFSPS
jgi:hypothetical protein